MTGKTDRPFLSASIYLFRFDSKLRQWLAFLFLNENQAPLDRHTIPIAMPGLYQDQLEEKKLKETATFMNS